MNATDFGHLSDNDHTRGICMWTWDNEWCAKPLVVENYRGSFKTPANDNKWGALYGIMVPNGIPTHTSMWICEKHRVDFLKLNSNSNLGVEIWQFNHNGIGKEVTWQTLHEVSVRIYSHLDAETLSLLMENVIRAEVRHNDDLDSWAYLKVVTT